MKFPSFNITERDEKAKTLFSEVQFRYTTHTGLGTPKLKQLNINGETEV